MSETNIKAVDFFLGTTTPLGFKGYFDTLLKEDNLHPILIKSGPGCGKSTMMKRLGEMASEDIERIHCASDPDSLDGVVFKKQNIAILDATAPHAIEPEAPGAVEEVLSLFHTMDNTLLQRSANDIKAENTAYRCFRLRIVRYISSVAGLLLDSRRAVSCATNTEKCNDYTKRFCDKEFRKQNSKGSEKIRFLSGITPKGIIFFKDNIPLLAKRITVIQDEYGAVSSIMLKQIRARALAAGYEIITCPCAVHPEDKIDHIFIPSLDLAILTSNSWHTVGIAGQKNIHAKRFIDKDIYNSYRTRLRFNKKATNELLEESFDLLQKAKACHDVIESYYKPAINFAEIDRITAETGKKLNF